MKKIYTLFVLMLMPLMAFAQTSRTINVATAGTLPDLISDEEKYTIEELTLTGELNGTDFRLLRDMAGNNYQGKLTDGKLKVLDLSNVNVVAGGEIVLETNRVEHENGSFGYGGDGLRVEIKKDNVLPEDLFKCCKIESVVFPKTLVEIESNVFADCTRLTSISISEGLTTIGWHAFYECVNLSKITVAEGNPKYDSRDNCNAIIETATNTLVKGCNGTVIPGTVTCIDGDGFSYCSHLGDIVIPKSVTEIRSWGYRYGGVTSVIVEAGNPVYDSRQNCNAIIETATNTLYRGFECSSIPTDVTSIGDYVFSGCLGRNTISIPENVKSIGNFAFNGCADLKSISLPSSLTSIGSYVFVGSSVGRVTIPASVTSIGTNAFSSTPFIEVERTTPIAVAEDVFRDREREVLIVPQGSKSAYAEADYWKEFKVILEGPIPDGNIEFADSRVKSICVSQWQWDLNHDLELSYCEAAAVTSLGDIFANNNGITSFDELQYFISLPSIEMAAFATCNKLTSIVIPRSVTTIKYSAFFNCKSLVSIVIPKSVTSIEKYAFTGCSGLTSITVEDGNPVYDSREKCNAVIETSTDKLILGCQNTKILDEIKIIGESSFYDNTGLSSISIPKNLITVEMNAFYGNSGLTSINVENGNAFYDSRGECNALIETSTNHLLVGCKNTIIPDGVTSIEKGAFSSCIGLSAISLPNSILSIGHSAFWGCKELKDVVLPDKLVSLGTAAFQYCEKLQSVTIPNSVTEIGINVFDACSKLVYVKSLIEEPFVISESIFNNYDNITLYVPKGAKEKYQATDGWKLFTNIVEPIDETYNSDLETPLTFEAVEGTVKVSFFNRWASASFPIKYRIDDGPWLSGIIREDGTWSTSHFVGKKLQFIAQFMTNTNNKYVHVSCDNDCYIYGNILSMTNGDDFATTSESGTCGKLFSGNTHIKNHPTKGLVLPATSLSNGCYMGLFSGCTSLTAAPELPATILSNRCYQEMFKGCSNINEIVCKAVDVSAENCTTSWLDGVSATGTFYKDASMTDWTEGVDGIPTGWTVKDFNTKVEKGDVVYTPHDEDHTVTVSDGGESSSEIVIQSSISINGVSYDVTAIGDCAFQNNELVVKVTIPETIASIGLKAFAGCINLKSIFIYVKVPINLSGVSASRTRVDGGSTVFSGVDTETCVLYVPAGSGEAYRNADVWKDFKNIVEIPVSASINVAKGMTTYTSEYNLDFSGFGDEVKAYVATGYDYDSQTIWLTRVKDVPAGTPILVKALASETPYDVPVKESSGCYYKNMFVANTTDGAIYPPETSGEMTNYYLSSGIFKTATGTNAINPGKCYLQIPTVAPTPVVGGSQYVKLNDYGFASFCGSQDLDFTDVEGLKAFAATGYDDAVGTIWLTRVKRVSAGTGLLLMGAANVEYTIPSTAVKSYYANMMVGNTSSETITIYTTSGDMTNYYLSGNKLLKAAAAGTAGNTIKPGKAYMQIPSAHVTRSIGDDPTENLSVYDLLEQPEVISMQVMTRGFGGDDDTTGIRETVQPRRDDNVFYNLQGQRVDRPVKGLYIRNGKVIVIK